MLLPLTILVRTSASDPPEERSVGLDPESIARVEDSNEEGVIDIWADGMDGTPYKVRGTVDEFIGYVNSFFIEEDPEGESCESACTDTG